VPFFVPLLLRPYGGGEKDRRRRGVDDCPPPPLRLSALEAPRRRWRRRRRRMNDAVVASVLSLVASGSYRKAGIRVKMIVQDLQVAQLQPGSVMGPTDAPDGLIVMAVSEKHCRYRNYCTVQYVGRQHESYHIRVRVPTHQSCEL
jgi:hypothetical protein